MKKRHMILAVLLACAMALPVILQADDDDKVISVLEALELEDGVKVVLEGLIVVDMGGELYLFRDDTADISLKTDEKAWKNREMDPGELVRIYGEVDHIDDLLVIDVKKIKDVKDIHKHDDEIDEGIDDYLEDDFLE